MTHMPIVRMQLEGDEFEIGLLGEIDRLPLRGPMADLVDAAVAAIPNLHVPGVAGLLVVPVDHKDVAVGTILKVDEPGPSIVGEQKVRPMTGDIARPLRPRHIHVEAMAVDVAHEKLIAIRVGPTAAEVDHQAAVGVAPAGAVGLVVAAVGIRAEVVEMIGDRLDVVVGVGVEMLTTLPMIPRPLNDVKRMRNHARLDEGLAAVVEVEAPRIAGALGEGLEDMPRRMIAPDCRVHRDPFRRRRAGFADFRVGEDAVTTVEPAVRSPGKSI